MEDDKERNSTEEEQYDQARIRLVADDAFAGDLGVTWQALPAERTRRAVLSAADLNSGRRPDRLIARHTVLAVAGRTRKALHRPVSLDGKVLVLRRDHMVGVRAEQAVAVGAPRCYCR